MSPVLVNPVVDDLLSAFCDIAVKYQPARKGFTAYGYTKDEATTVMNAIRVLSNLIEVEK